MTGSELIAQAEALEAACEAFYDSRKGVTIPPPQMFLLAWLDERASELRAQAQAEQPAEPVAWMNDDDGDIVPNMDGNIDMGSHGWIPLYAHPDPRIAALEGLLREAKAWVPHHRQNSLYERIEAALNASQTERN